MKESKSFPSNAEIISTASNLCGITAFFLGGFMKSPATANKVAQGLWAFAAGASAIANMSKEDYVATITPRKVVLDVSTLALSTAFFATIPLKSSPLPITAREASLGSLIAAGMNKAITESEEKPLKIQDKLSIISRTSNALGVAASIAATRFPAYGCLSSAAYAGWAVPGFGNAAKQSIEQPHSNYNMPRNVKEGIAAVGGIAGVMTFSNILLRKPFLAKQCSLIALAATPASKLVAPVDDGGLPKEGHPQKLYPEQTYANNSFGSMHYPERVSRKVTFVEQVSGNVSPFLMNNANKERWVKRLTQEAVKEQTIKAAAQSFR